MNAQQREAEEQRAALNRAVQLVTVCAAHDEEDAMPFAQWQLEQLVGPHYAALFVRKCLDVREVEKMLPLYLK